MPKHSAWQNRQAPVQGVQFRNLARCVPEFYDGMAGSADIIYTAGNDPCREYYEYFRAEREVA